MSAEATRRPTYAADFIKGDWDRSAFLPDPHVDNLMTAFVGLGGEHWALRRRLLVIESLLAAKGALALSDIEGYQPSVQERATWEKDRDDFIERVFSVLTRKTADVSGPIDQESGSMRPPRGEM